MIGLESSLASGTWAKVVSPGGNGELGEWREGEPEGSLSYCFKKIHWEGKTKRLCKWVSGCGLGSYIFQGRLICDHLGIRAWGWGKGRSG